MRAWTGSPAPGSSRGSSTGRPSSCSSPAFLDRYGLDAPALRALALVVRGADTEARALAPEAPGLYALASGFRALARDDHENMRLQFPAYDALYAYCRARVHGAPARGPAPPPGGERG